MSGASIDCSPWKTSHRCGLKELVIPLVQLRSITNVGLIGLQMLKQQQQQQQHHNQTQYHGTRIKESKENEQTSIIFFLFFFFFKTI